MFGTKGTTAAQPAAKKTAPPPSKPAPAQSQRDSGRRGGDDSRRSGDEKPGLLTWLIRIFSILLLLFSPLVLFFLIAMIINPYWIRTLLGCHDDCSLPLPYIWPILICFLLEVILALFSLLWARTDSRTTCLVFAVSWSFLLLVGILLYCLSNDWIVLVCAVGLAILWVLKFAFTSDNRR